MKELAGRLTALDPDAGAAVRVIAYFDRLAESRAGVEALVRGAAVLAGCPARLVDPDRRVHVRVEADGIRRDAGPPPDPAWPSAPLDPEGAGALWLERAGAGPGAVSTRAEPTRVGTEPLAAAPSVVDAVLLERAAGALRVVLDRTRGRAPADDPALVETLLDATAPEQARVHAARRLGLDPASPARAVAPLNGRPRVISGVVPPGGPARADAALPFSVLRGTVDAGPGGAPARTEGADPAAEQAGTRSGTGLPAARLGIGPAVPVLELPRSWAEARTALRFTAEGTAQDPGPRVVYADELGGIALLADLVAPGSEPPPDVRALETAAATAPWLPATLHAVASTASLRAAAAGINLHHSTLQDRLTHAEHLLGWPIRTPQGRLRLQLALAMRRLARP
ncbi:helix-turn-helix domain-containing protein [Streptomyces hawaiiensis]|uniref:CdaR family transcriptional regulator n=1 Tax=Streptomyces hawaiiensis TaxID=67305 RepID=A0A6G5RQC2_9ACTN|nr:helix-turn-helix domain-containing protein [Streptomyces hawaiiensis]QCD59757.1 CdaR family transcriptional regulator [Streptomyces hawaiiensis]